MNFVRSFVSRILPTTATRSVIHQNSENSLLDLCSRVSQLHVQERRMASLYQMHRTGPHRKNRPSKNPLDGNPFMKGTVLKVVIKKPKKPNSANRKCVLVRLRNDKEMFAYIPGKGHNLQENSVVLCRVGRLRDCPGVKLKLVRGKYDLEHIQKEKKE